MLILQPFFEESHYILSHLCPANKRWIYKSNFRWNWEHIRWFATSWWSFWIFL